MACGCSDDVCGCELNTSNTVSVTGSGQSGDPWFASVIPEPTGGLHSVALGVGMLLDPDACNILTLSAAGLLGLVHVEDSPSVSFSGCGTAADPIVATVLTGGGGGAVSSILPGMITMTGGSTPDVNHVFCDGATYDAVADPTFLPMYNRIGTLWGGTGPSDFKVPPMNARSPMGPGVDSTGAGLTTRAAGTLLGVETVALTIAQLPVHDHTIADHFHTVGNHFHPIDHDHVVTDSAFVNANFNDHADPNFADNFPGDPVEGMAIFAGNDATGSGRINFRIESSSHGHGIDPLVDDSGLAGAGNTSTVSLGTTGDTGSGDAHQTIHPVTVLHFQISK